MKIAQLQESTNMDINNLDYNVLKEYSQGINAFIEGGPALFKGLSYEFDDTIIGKLEPIQDRKPRNADTHLYHYLFKLFEPWKSLPPRNVICTNDSDNASNYGTRFYIIPKNGTTLCILPDDDL